MRMATSIEARYCAAMLALYSIPESLYSAKLRIMLRHKGLDFEERDPPGGYGSDAYKRVVPSGNIPALIHGDLLLADSEAIAEYLEEAFPRPPMLPEELDARARVRERSRFHDTRLEPEIRKLFSQVAPQGRDTGIVAAQRSALNTRLAQFAVMLAHRTDEMLTLGDCGFPISFEWIEAFDAPLGLGIDWPDAVVQYRASLAEHSAVSRELTAYRPCVTDWIASRH